MSDFTLRGRTAPLQWCALLGASLVLICGPRVDRPACGVAPRVDRGGDPARVVRRARQDSGLVLHRRARRRRLPRGAKHQSRHPDGDAPPVADVHNLHRHGHSFRDHARLTPRPLQGASGHDGRLGLLARRGDRHGVDGQRARRRHEACRRHAIPARRLGRTCGLGGGAGVGAVARPRPRSRPNGSRPSQPAPSSKRWRWPSWARQSAL